MEKAVQNCVKEAGIPLEEAIRMATLYPARVANIDDVLGSIAVGKRACFVELSSKSLEVLKVWFDGRPLP